MDVALIAIPGWARWACQNVSASHTTLSRLAPTVPKSTSLPGTMGVASTKRPRLVAISRMLDGADASVSEVMLDAPNALYAFMHSDQVVYIGKTARSIRWLGGKAHE